jgi:predicted nucleic acid-binding protein
MLFVYWFEENPSYASRVDEIRRKMQHRSDTLCTSVFTIGEVLAGAYQAGAPERASKTLQLFAPPHVEILPFTSETANRYAQIRGTARVSPADAIHLACAAQSGVELFLTNDHRLQKLIVPGIAFIAGMDVNLF